MVRYTWRTIPTTATIKKKFTDVKEIDSLAFVNVQLNFKGASEPTPPVKHNFA